MRIVRFQTQDGKKPKYGWLWGDKVGEISGNIYGRYIRQDAKTPLADVKLLPPCEPSKIVCVGRNYVEHAKELGNEVPKVPLIFMKPPSSIIGNGEAIILPPQSAQVEHEAELVIVIGKRGKNVTTESARKHILGYTIGNDVTGRDLTAKGATRAAGVYLMIVDDRVYLFTDATVNIDPTAEDLAEIACLAADFAKRLELDPRVAFLSFSNFGSTPHPLSDKVRKAVELTKTCRPDLIVVGEMQADTSIVADIIENRYPFSKVKDANVLVFPSLESANIAYKLLARLGNAKAIGPILLGMGAPVHVLQTGDDVNDIVQIASVAVMDAMGREGK